MSRVILHIDMNSYFASVSQHFSPELQNKPIAVMGRGKGTVVIAASKEAKKFGIKTGTTKKEALERYPEIIFVAPDFAAYVHITSILLDTFHQYTPLVEPFSIDEAFLDITNSYEIIHGMHPVQFALNIKKNLQQKLGNIITCSIGIADNKLMAKFGSDLKKPDGLVYLTPQNYTKVLDQYPLSDICGIGTNTVQHLQRIGITTINQLRTISYMILKKEFGRVTGRFLYNASRGLDFHNVDPLKYYTAPKSISHGETFIENKTGSDLFTSIYKLCEKVSLRLRKKKLFTKNISIYLRDSKFKSISFGKNLGNYTHNTADIFSTVLSQIPKDFTARYVCIYAHNLSHIKQLDLFGSTVKHDSLQIALDKINIKYGHFTIIPASIHKPDMTDEKSIEIPFSGFDTDAKIGIDLTTLLRKDLDIIKHRTLHMS